MEAEKRRGLSCAVEGRPLSPFVLNQTKQRHKEETNRKTYKLKSTLTILIPSNDMPTTKFNFYVIPDFCAISTDFILEAIFLFVLRGAAESSLLTSWCAPFMANLSCCRCPSCCPAVLPPCSALLFVRRRRSVRRRCAARLCPGVCVLWATREGHCCCITS